MPLVSAYAPAVSRLEDNHLRAPVCLTSARYGVVPDSGVDMLLHVRFLCQIASIDPHE